jgi:hypothetical protein
MLNVPYEYAQTLYAYAHKPTTYIFKGDPHVNLLDTLYNIKRIPLPERVTIVQHRSLIHSTRAECKIAVDQDVALDVQLTFCDTRVSLKLKQVV